jgi:hypothetical protein
MVYLLKCGIIYWVIKSFSKEDMVYTKKHNCPNTVLSEKIRLSSTKWIATTILYWVRTDQSIGPSELKAKLSDRFNVVTPYHRIFHGKEMALDLIKGKWNGSFDMHSFKVEIEKRSPMSIVDIDYEIVRGRVKSSIGEKYKNDR